jgi:mRNA interferase RelE/StbE
MYGLAFLPGGKRDLDKLPASMKERVTKALALLADNPRPPGCLKMTDEAAWRFRVGSYRVIYDILDDQKLVLIRRVDDRKDVYRK